MDVPLLDPEEVADLSLAELYAARGTLSARIDRLYDERRIIDQELIRRGPARFGETVMLPPSSKWTPYDGTFAAIRRWCGDAATFLAVAHIDYVRSTGLEELARERGEDPQTVLNSLGSRLPASKSPSFVPLHRAPKWTYRLPDALAEDAPPEPGPPADLLEALRASVEAAEAKRA